MSQKLFASLAIFLLVIGWLPLWQAKAETLPNITNAYSEFLADVSCASAAFCMAVGQYSADAASGEALVLTRTNGAWKIIPGPKPAASFDHAQLNTVACTSDKFCIAAGQYSLNHVSTQGWLETYNGTGWQQQSFGGMSGTTINDIACGPSVTCLAVGGVSEGYYNHARVFLFDGNHWEQASNPTIASLGLLSAVDCFANGCAVAGGTPSVISSHYALATLNYGSWSLDTNFEPASSGVFRSLSCTSATDCTVLGNDMTHGGRVLAHRAATGWAVIDRSNWAPMQTGHIWQQVACTQGSCMLAGELSQLQSDVSTVHGIVDQSATNNWQTNIVEPVNNSPLSSDKLSSRLITLTCKEAFCLTLGNYYQGGKTGLYAASLQSGKWQTEELQKPASTPEPVLSQPPITQQVITPATGRLAVVPSIFASADNDYIAFGDSITTGFSIPTCDGNQVATAWGCSGQPPATPYPSQIAAQLGLNVQRVGIWGYTVQQAAQAKRLGHNGQGNWQPQLLAIEGANKLVTGALGINDLGFSNVGKWAKLYLTSGAAGVQRAAQQIIAQRSADFDELFKSLRQARQHGAKVAITLYYNPYDSSDYWCADLKSIGASMVDQLDAELEQRAQANDLLVADFRPAFRGHGAGSSESYVFGSQCRITSAIADWLPDWLGGGGAQQVAEKFDPHPNNQGTTAMANLIIKEVQNAAR